MKNQRLMAIEILKGILFEDKRIEDFNNQLYKYNNQESGFIRTLVLGTLRYKFQLDYYLGQISNKPINKIDKDVLLILELSLYQLIYMDHIPDRAIIHEAVELTKKLSNYWSSKFVNGVLRNFLRKKDLLDEDISNLQKDEILSIKYSYPIWIIEKIRASYGEDYEKALEVYNKEIPFVIRYNCLKTSKKDFLNLLRSKSYDVEEVEASPSAVIVRNPKGIFEEDFYNEGYFYVQSVSSQMVGDICKKYLFPNINILDLCSAPGGKTSHLYELSGGSANILALDVGQEKINLLNENMKRLGHNVETGVNDATVLNKDYIERFKLVLLDAPCSAIGLIRRFPEIKTKLKEKSIDELAMKQYKILENAIKYLDKEGILLYSTCSFTLEENENVIGKLMKKNSDLELLEKYNVKPWEIDSDGFSIFVLKRR